jgi:hypothetical protein
MSPKNFFCHECPILIPKVPLEAPFTEMTQFNNPVNLAPSVPLEVTFDDMVDISEPFMLHDLMPQVPAIANFTEEL